MVDQHENYSNAIVSYLQLQTVRWLVLCHTDIAQLGDWSILGALNRIQGVLYAQEVHSQTQLC